MTNTRQHTSTARLPLLHCTVLMIIIITLTLITIFLPPACGSFVQVQSIQFKLLLLTSHAWPLASASAHSGSSPAPLSREGLVSDWLLPWWQRSVTSQHPFRHLDPLPLSKIKLWDVLASSFLIEKPRTLLGNRHLRLWLFKSYNENKRRQSSWTVKNQFYTK